MAPSKQPQAGRRSGIAVATVLLAFFSLGGFALQYSRAVANRPTAAERIYARLTEWGVDAVGLGPPTDASEIERRIGQLRSDVSEQRVRAARWLAARGIGSAGDEIAASMSDAETRRPCQLAHSLGKLGDDRWARDLLDAATQTGNRDLRTCAAIGLTHLASSRSVEGLIEVTREDPSRVFAIRALGETGDPRAMDHLRWLRHHATSRTQVRAIEIAIERVEILSMPDPVPTLLRRVERSARGENVDAWALRHIARRADSRCVVPLARVLETPGLLRTTRELLAAALLAHGADGLAALDQVSGGGEAGEVASIARGLASSAGRRGLTEAPRYESGSGPAVP